jgi:hypothetical protein
MQEWVLSIRDQCQAGRGALLLQAGGGVRKSKTGRELDGTEYDAIPARIQLPVLEKGRRLAALAEIEERLTGAKGEASPRLFPVSAADESLLTK